MTFRQEYKEMLTNTREGLRKRNVHSTVKACLQAAEICQKMNGKSVVEFNIDFLKEKHEKGN